MPKLASQIAPQRSTQYAQLASQLAAPELQLSPLGSHIQHVEPTPLGGQEYLLLDLDQPLDDALLHELGTLAMTSAHDWWTWPAAMASGHGQWPWPMASGHGNGQWPWPLAIARSHG